MFSPSPSDQITELLAKPRGPKSAWLPVFMEFLGHLKITSKETGTGPIVPYTAQLIALEQICDGLDEGLHYHVCLKARQLGISTLLMALDLFWLTMNPGLQGAIIADTADNVEAFRNTITQMIDNLPAGFRIKVKRHNRNALILANGSQLQYLSAGVKRNSGLGRSRAFNFAHCSEMCKWGDMTGLDALIRALAEEHPARLYVFESTALGFNMFNDMWEEAKESPSQKAFFIGWWAKHTYRLKEGTREFETWWGKSPEPTTEEAMKAQLVKDLYGWDVTPEQFAWYRKQSFQRSAQTLASELPWTEHEAFQATGSPYFSLARVTQDMGAIKAAQSEGAGGFTGYAYEFGDRFTDLRPVRLVNKADEADLRVWEEPNRRGKYAIGVDPAYGRDKFKDGDPDRSVIEVFRCYADQFVQVAEFATDRPEPRQLAWVLAHLAGVYRDCIINLEITGPGGLLMGEIRHLKELMRSNPQHFPVARDAEMMGIKDSLNSARWFLWNRVDSLGGGYAYNTSTTSSEKDRIYGTMRDEYNSQTLIVRSLPLLEEMTRLVQDGVKIEASGRHKDDRVFATGLAAQAHVKWIRSGMISQLRTFERETQAEADELAKTGTVINGMLANYFEKKKTGRSDAERQRAEGGY